MEIDGKEVKAIRPMTYDEYMSWVGDEFYYGGGGKNIFVIDFVDGTTLLPKSNCISCMRREECLFSLVKYI